MDASPREQTPAQRRAARKKELRRSLPRELNIWSTSPRAAQRHVDELLARRLPCPECGAAEGERCFEIQRWNDEPDGYGPVLIPAHWERRPWEEFDPVDA